MNTIDTLEALEQLYDDASPNALIKVANKLTPHYQTWVEQSSFVILATVGPEGTDASPRGDREQVATVVDSTTLWLPDWKGNNRLDTLRNIVQNGNISLLFMIHGCNNVVRINGRATLSVDPQVIGHFERDGSTPKSVIVVQVGEVYFQCAKALMRSQLWESRTGQIRLPTAGDFLKEAMNDFDAVSYDRGYAEYAKRRMW